MVTIFGRRDFHGEGIAANPRSGVTREMSEEFVKRFGRQNIFVEKWHSDCSVQEPHGAGIGKEQLSKHLAFRISCVGDAVEVALKYAPRDVAGKYTGSLLKDLDEKIFFAPDSGSKLPNHFAAASLCQEMNFRRSP